MERLSANDLAHRLLAMNTGRADRVAPELVALVAADLGLPPPAVDHQWPTDVAEAIREVLRCAAADDLSPLSRPGGRFERLGLEAARTGLEFDQLAAGIRLAGRRLQTHVHRAMLEANALDDTEAALELLGRVFAAVEAVVLGTRRGYDLAAMGQDPSESDRRLASALMLGSSDVVERAVEAGWSARTYVCAALTSPADLGALRKRSRVLLAFYPRERDVVLFHPVVAGKVATSLRPILNGRARAVGPAVPLADVRQSLDLASRAAHLPGAGGRTVFADDVLLQLACGADPTVGHAMRYKHLAPLDELPEDQRVVLTDTLREWLVHWGHRPAVATALHVHPQTVSGRINRLKDLLATDLDDPVVRSELLLLLMAESRRIT